MRTLSAGIVMAVLGGGALYARPPLVTTSTLFTKVGDYPLGAATIRTDYESIDAAARRLYISKMGAGRLIVFDIEHAKLIAELSGFPRVTAVLVVPELHKVYASVPGGGIVSYLTAGLALAGLSAGHGTIAILDTRDLKPLARLPGGVFPDGIAFDPRERRIFVSDELGSAVTVIDADTNRVLSRIATGGEVGNVRYDPAIGRVFVPVQSRDELIEMDPKRLVITARHALAGCDHPHGLMIAPKGDVGYVACDENDRLLTVDLATAQVLGNTPVAHDPDVLALDAKASRLYVAGESGDLSVFDIAAERAPAQLGEVYVAKGAHAVAVDPATHRLYLALADLRGRSMLRVLAPKSIEDR